MESCPKTLFLALFLFAHVCAFGAPNRPPSTWTWEEITKDFAALGPIHRAESRRDGVLLKKIDPDRALAFLLPFLSKERTQNVRLNALAALDEAALPDSAPFIERIVLDADDDPTIRSAALGNLAKFDKARASEVGIACLRDKERQVRNSACWVLSELGGEAVTAALKDHFLSSDEKGSAVGALGRTKDPEVIRFLIAHTSLDELRKDCGLQQSYAGAMGATPLPEAYGAMLTLLREGCFHARDRALPYFRAFPYAEIGSDIVAHFEEREMRPTLRTYADVWFFANSPGLTAEARNCLRQRVRATYPEAVFDKVPAEPAEIGENTRVAVIRAANGNQPASLSPDERSAVHALQRIADDQVLVRKSVGTSVWGYLVVRKEGNWVRAASQLLRSVCP